MEKRTSTVWLVFLKEKQLDGTYLARCTAKVKDEKDCGKTLKINATSDMKKHIQHNHKNLYEELFDEKTKVTKQKVSFYIFADMFDLYFQGAQKTMDSYTLNAMEFQLKADKEIILFIARKNESFAVVEDIFMKNLLTTKFGSNVTKTDEYYRTTGLDNVFDSFKDTIVQKVHNKKIGITSDLWSTLNSDVSIMVLTATVMTGWTRENFILAVKSIKCKHTADNISDIFNKILVSMKVEKANIVFLSRDNGSNMVAAAKIIGITSLQCGAHCLNLIVKDCVKKCKKSGDDEQLYDIIERAKFLASSFSRSGSRRQSLVQHQEQFNLAKIRIQKIIDIRWNSLYLSLNTIVKNQRALIGMLMSKEKIYVKPEDFPVMEEVVKVLKSFYDETLRVSCF